MNQIVLFAILLSIVALSSGGPAKAIFTDKSLSDVATTVHVKEANKTYHFNVDQKVNWYKAGQICRQNGLQLATITSQEEQFALVAAQIWADFWTSGNDLAETGSYFWQSTGEDFVYTRWESSEPNHMEDGEKVEHCVQMRRVGLYWNDAFCSEEYYFICETVN